MITPISQFVAENKFADGRRVRVYLALRDVFCSPCGAIIAAGEFFTREEIQGIYLTPHCQKCAPFPRPKQSARALLDALEPRPTTPAESLAEAHRLRAQEEMKKRIGPALDRIKRRRFDAR